MLNYVRDLTFDPRAKPSVVNWTWQIMAACSCNASIKQAKINWICHRMCLCISFWYYNHFGYLKDSNEVNREYFLQAVLLCLLYKSNIWLWLYTCQGENTHHSKQVKSHDFTLHLVALGWSMSGLYALANYASIILGIIWYMQHRSIFQHNAVALGEIWWPRMYVCVGEEVSLYTCNAVYPKTDDCKNWKHLDIHENTSTRNFVLLNAQYNIIIYQFIYSGTH